MEITNKPGIGTGVMLMKGNQILLGKRTDKTAHGPGTWTMPGGKLEYGESFEECVKRETLEECDIVLNKIRFISLKNDISGNAHFATIGFYCDDFTGEQKVMEPDKITEWQWFDLDNLPDNLFMPTENVLKNYKNKTFYTNQ